MRTSLAMGRVDLLAARGAEVAGAQIPEVASPVADDDAGSSNDQGSSRRYAVVVGLLSCITAGLALSSLTNQSIWIDESFTMAVATAPGDRFVEDLAHNGGNMSLYLVFMRGWLVLGDSDWWLRLPSVLFAAACVPAFFCLARRFVSDRAAVAGAGLVGLSGPLIHHAQEARSYPLTVLLVILSWIAVVRLWRAPSRRSRRWYVLAATAVVYSHLIALLFVAAQLVWLLSARRRDALFAGGWVGLLVLPQFVMAFGPRAHEPSWIPETTAAAIVATIRYLTGTTYSGAAIVGSVWALGAYIALRRADHLSLAPVAWVVLPFCGLLAVSELSPMFLPRYLVMVIPGAVLLLCIAWEAYPRFGALLMLVVLLFGLPGLDSALTRTAPDWRVATRLLLENAESDEAVLFLNSRHLVERYWDQLGRPSQMPIPLSSPHNWGPLQRNYTIDAISASSTLDAADGAWVVERRRSSQPPPPQRRLFAMIKSRWPATESWRLDGGAIVITRYGGDGR